MFPASCVVSIVSSDPFAPFQLYSHSVKPQLTFSETEAERVLAMRRGIGNEQNLQVVQIPSHQLVNCDNLDAVYMSVSAAESLGAYPILHKAQILTNRENDLRGWPLHVIAGVAMEENDPRDAGSELRLILNAVLEVVGDFNRKGDEQINNIGFAPEWTGIRRLDPLHAGRIIRETYDLFVEST